MAEVSQLYNLYIKMTTLSSITDCVLFVDMPNLGGGTTFFVNSLISHFKVVNLKASRFWGSYTILG